MIRLRPLINFFHRNVRCYFKNHYETLKVSKTATIKEIRESFVKLSKELHPDKRPNDPKSHSEFVKLNEAYTVLSKWDTRSLYDTQLRQGFANPSSSSVRTNHPRWTDETLWQYRDRSKDKQYEGKPYYGIKGIKRMPNFWIASACIAFMVIGMIFQFYSLKFGRGILNDKAKRVQESNEKILIEKQTLAKKLGTDAQLERMADRVNSEKRSKK